MNETILWPLPPACVVSAFARRVKRFTVETVKDGETVLAHCNDTGAMTGLLREGSPVLLSPATNPDRKLPYSLERVYVATGNKPGVWVGVNSRAPNVLLKRAFERGLLPFASGYANFRSEVTRGSSRLDALITAPARPPLWVECKSAALARGELCLFPDAPSQRARKHLLELMAAAQNGDRAAMFYLVRQPNARAFCPAADIDPEYAKLFYAARNAGVEIYAYAENSLPSGSGLGRRLPVV